MKKVKIEDKVVDENKKPIVNVQINFFKPDDDLIDSNIIVQNYTNPKGYWNIEINPGKYIIEYFHPKFETYTEKIEITQDGKIKRL